MSTETKKQEAEEEVCKHECLVAVRQYTGMIENKDITFLEINCNECDARAFLQEVEIPE